MLKAPAGQMSLIFPPEISTFFSLPDVKNPM